MTSPAARRPRRLFRAAGATCGPLARALALALAVPSCNFPDSAPAGLGWGPVRASLALETDVVMQSANAINVTVTYARTRGVGVLVDSTAKIRRASDGSLGWEGDRGYPFELDLAPCLLDPAHVPAGEGCLIGITVRLLEDGEVLDLVVIDPFPVEPGVITTVPQPISLHEVGSVVVVAPGARIVVGQMVSLATRVADVEGTALPDRAVTWRSSDESVARIDAHGFVTALAPGEVTLIARAGRREGSLVLTIAAP